VDASGIVHADAGGRLTHPRRRPAAAYVDRKLVVAGGQAEGAPLFEILTAGSTIDPATPFATSTTEARYAPVLTTDLAHARAFLVLGSADAHDDALVRQTTYELTTCTVSGCTVTDGPAFTDARAGAAAVTHGVGSSTPSTAQTETLLVGGTEGGVPSPLVDRITFDGMHFRLEPSGGMLRAPRDQPGATEIGGGVILVGGGADADGNARNTLELCFPRILAPISAS
jgi:hypothetical protein